MNYLGNFCNNYSCDCDGLGNYSTVLISLCFFSAMYRQDCRQSTMAVLGDNLYVAWWRNETGNTEVIFKVSNDNGQTFGDRINISTI